MKGKVCILLVLVLGLVIVPGLSRACAGTGAEMRAVNHLRSCCSQMTGAKKATACHLNLKTAKTAPGNCCDTHGTHPSSDPCRGHCHHGCHCTVMTVTTLLTYTACLALPAFYTTKLQAIAIPIRLPSGFDFIWRPPKIG